MIRRAFSREAMHLAIALALGCLAIVACPRPVHAQARSGAQSVDACLVAPQAKIEAAIGRKLKPQNMPPGTPPSTGVSMCLWATSDGRKSLSVSTYAPAAVKNTQAKTIDLYFESLKTRNAGLWGRPRVIQGVVKRAVSFPAGGSGDTILVLRGDCTVVMNVAGFSAEEVVGIARAAGQ